MPEEYIPLPKQGTRCPFTGCVRSKLQKLVKSGVIEHKLVTGGKGRPKILMLAKSAMAAAVAG